MSIDDIKLKRFTSKFGAVPLRQRQAPQSAPTPSDGKAEPPDSLEESTSSKESKQPKFVQHCIAAITSRPDTMSALKRSKVSPFAICNASYSKDKQALDVKHASGDHHTAEDYRRAMKKLGESLAELRASRPSRDSIVFGEGLDLPRGIDRSTIVYRPE